MIALGGSQDGEEGQGPDALGPGNRSQQHHGDPAQAAGFDKEGLAGADGIAINTFGDNLGSTSALDMLIQTNHDWCVIWDKGADELEQQDAAEGSAGPRGTVEHAMIVLKL